MKRDDVVKCELCTQICCSFFAKVFLYNICISFSLSITNLTAVNERERGGGESEEDGDEDEKPERFSRRFALFGAENIRLHSCGVWAFSTHSTHKHTPHMHTLHTHTHTLAGCMHICRWSNDCGPATVFFYTAAGLNCLAQALPRPPPAQQRQSIHYTMLHTCTHNLICSCNCFGPYGRDGKRCFS